jgi:uncharacterized protein YifE (UPF0438 family)
MTENDKQIDFDYVQAKGKFNVNVSHVAFSPGQLAILENFGQWFEALTNGTESPSNAEQQQFVEVAHMQRKSRTDNEIAWSRYLKRKKIETDKGATLHQSPQPNEDPFCSRDMAKQVRNTMYKVTRDNHSDYK